MRRVICQLNGGSVPLHAAELCFVFSRWQHHSAVLAMVLPSD